MNDKKSIVINGVQYYSAYFSCPICIEMGITYPPSFWVHNSCPNDHLYIGSDATIYCSGCGRKIKIMDAQYACPHHSESVEYIVAFEGDNINIEGMSHITIPEAASVMCVFYGMSWVRKFLESFIINEKL